MATFLGSIMAGCCSFISERGIGSLEPDTIVGEVFCLGGVVLRVGLGRVLFCDVAVILVDFEPWTPPLATAPGEEVLLLRALVGFVAFLGGVVVVLWWVEPWGVIL